MRCSLRVRPYIPSYALLVVVFWRCRNKEPHSSGFLCRVVLSGTKSNNFRWLNAVKETKIEFFVRDNSGEKFLTAHAARRNFSEVIYRACAVVVHSWFSHLHGKFCVLALRTFPTRPAPFELRIWLVGTVGSQRPVLILVFPDCMCRFFPSAGRARRL